VESDTILLPDLLLSEASITTNEKYWNNKSVAVPPSTTGEYLYAATGIGTSTSIGNGTDNNESSLDCKHIPGNECPNVNGRFYYLSRDLASLMGSIDDTDTAMTSSVTSN
jgi:hypothetical protein